MICKSFLALCFTFALCAPVFADTDQNHGSNIYVPDYRLEKIYQVPAGDIYAVRGGFRRLDNFVELWARIIPRDHEQKTLDFWKNELIPVDNKTAYAHVKLHFYCRSSEVAIPALYLFDEWSQLINSRVVMMDEPLSTKGKPVLKQIKELACSGKIDKLGD